MVLSGDSLTILTLWRWAGAGRLLGPLTLCRFRVGRALVDGPIAIPLIRFSCPQSIWLLFGKPLGRGTMSEVNPANLFISTDIEAHPETNLPMLKSGMTLCLAAADGWRRLQEERKEAQEELGRRVVPAWWEVREIVRNGKKTRGEQRAAKRERERVDAELGKVEGLEIGGEGGGKGGDEDEEMEEE